MKKVQTSINIDERLLLSVKDSGVGNVSRYVERLIKQDLQLLVLAGKRRERRLALLRERLDRWQLKWDAYVAEEAEEKRLEVGVDG